MATRYIGRRQFGPISPAHWLGPLPSATVAPSPPGPFGPKPSPTGAGIIGLAYGNSRLMLLDGGGAVYTSSDTGSTWTLVGNVPGVGAVGNNQLVFFGGKWFAFPGDASVYRSTDNGATWTLTSSGILASTTFSYGSGDGPFIIVYSSGSETGVSTDGIAWTHGTYAGNLSVTSGPNIPLWDGANYDTTGSIAGLDQIVQTPDGTTFSNTSIAANPYSVYTLGGGFFFASGGGDGTYRFANSIPALPGSAVLFIPGANNPPWLALYTVGNATWTAFETFGSNIWETTDPGDASSWTNPYSTPGLVNPRILALAGNKYVVSDGVNIYAQ